MIPAVFRRPGRWWPLYIGWIALCALLFAALGRLEDPSRPHGRILSNDAGVRALQIAEARGMRGLEVVHVAAARAGEGAAEERWIVLLDQVPHSGGGVVVELRARDGRLLALRAPVK